MQKLNSASDLAVLRSQLSSDMEEQLDVEAVIRISQQKMQELDRRFDALAAEFGNFEASFQKLGLAWEEVDRRLAVEKERSRLMIEWGLRREERRRREEEEEEKMKELRGEGKGGDKNEQDGDGQGADDKKNDEDGGDQKREEGDGGDEGADEDKKRKRKDSGDSTPSSIELESSQSEERRSKEVLNTSTVGQGAEWEIPNARHKKHKHEKIRRETKKVRTVSPELGLPSIAQRKEGKLLDDNSKIDHDPLQTKILLLEGRLKRYDDDMDKRVKKLERRMRWNELELEKLRPHYKRRSDVRDEEEEKNKDGNDDDDDDDGGDEDYEKLQDNNDNNNNHGRDDCNNDHNNDDDGQNLPSLPADHPTTGGKHPPPTIPSDYGVEENPSDGWHPGFSSDTTLVNSNTANNDRIEVKDPVQEPSQQRNHEHDPSTSMPENGESTAAEGSSEVDATELVNQIMNDDAPEGEEVREVIRRSGTLDGAAKYVTRPGKGNGL